VSTAVAWTAAEYSTPRFAQTSAGKRAIILITIARVNLFLQHPSLPARSRSETAQFYANPGHAVCERNACQFALSAASEVETPTPSSRRDGGIARLILRLAPARCALRGQPSAVRIRSRRIRRTGRFCEATGSSTLSLRHIRKTPFGFEAVFAT